MVICRCEWILKGYWNTLHAPLLAHMLDHKNSHKQTLLDRVKAGYRVLNQLLL